NPDLRTPLQSAQGAVSVLVASFERLVTLNTQVSARYESGILNSGREISSGFSRLSESAPHRAQITRAYAAFFETLLALNAYYNRPDTAAADQARSGIERVEAALD